MLGGICEYPLTKLSGPAYIHAWPAGRRLHTHGLTWIGDRTLGEFDISVDRNPGLFSVNSICHRISSWCFLSLRRSAGRWLD